MEVLSNATQLIAVVLQWACSCYREGVYRGYLTTRLLRRWSHLGADVYEAVVSYLHDMSWVETGDPGIVFRIVGELVRSKTFAAGRYLQWLIATGSLGHNMDLTSPAAWPVRLITEIPLTGLADQIRTLRCTLLRGTPHSAEMEEQALGRAEHMISQSLPGLFGLYNAIKRSSDVKLEELSSSVKLELGIWLRRQVANYAEVNERVPTKDPAVEETAAVSLLTSLEFHIVRTYLERFGDLAILADVVGIATSSLDAAVLAAAADTINYHFKVFRAMGACDPLFNRIAMRYAALRTIRFPERELLLSLSNLARVVQADGQLPQLLSYDLSRIDQKNSIAACSPASDNMGEVLQTGSYSDDEIERILASGTSMDQQIMARVLRKIISNLQEHVMKGSTTFESYPAWLHRLRSFDEATFDMVTNEWLSSTMSVSEVTPVQVTVPILVGAGCMSLSSVLETLRALVVNMKNHPSDIGFSRAVSVLQILLPHEDLVATCPPQDAYRYRLEQRRLCYTSTGLITSCIADVVALGSALSSQKDHSQILGLMSSKPVICIMRHCLVADRGNLSKASRDAMGPYFKLLLHTLLDPSGRYQLQTKSPDQQVLAVFEMASELSLPICQAVIEQIFSADTTVSGESAELLSAALLSAIKTVVEKSQSTGLELLASLDASLTDQVSKSNSRVLVTQLIFPDTTSCGTRDHRCGSVSCRSSPCEAGGVRRHVASHGPKVPSYYRPNRRQAN
jgi:mediator of RNA polymerase II transcription subunit 12